MHPSTNACMYIRANTYHHTHSVSLSISLSLSLLFIAALLITKLFAGEEGERGRTCAMRYDKPRLVWTSLTITHHDNSLCLSHSLSRALSLSHTHNKYTSILNTKEGKHTRNQTWMRSEHTHRCLCGVSEDDPRAGMQSLCRAVSPHACPCV